MEDLHPPDIFTRDPPGGVRKTVIALASFARHHLRLARAALNRVPQAATPAFLPLAIVEPLLRRVERLGDAIVTENAGLSDLEILVRIGAARLRGIGRKQAT